MGQRSRRMKRAVDAVSSFTVDLDEYLEGRAEQRPRNARDRPRKTDRGVPEIGGEERAYRKLSFSQTPHIKNKITQRKVLLRRLSSAKFRRCRRHRGFLWQACSSMYICRSRNPLLRGSIKHRTWVVLRLRKSMQWPGFVGSLSPIHLATDDNGKGGDTGVNVGRNPFFGSGMMVNRLEGPDGRTGRSARFGSFFFNAKLVRKYHVTPSGCTLPKPAPTPHLKSPVGRPCSRKNQNGRHSFKLRQTR